MPHRSIGDAIHGLIFTACSTVLCLILSHAVTADEPRLELTQKISLKGPAGRLDHLALDPKNERLFVANMANSSLDVVDLKAGTLVKQIPNQRGIQGVAYALDLDRIFVGNGEGDCCNVLDGRDYKLLKSFPLPDSDNVRYVAGTQRLYVAHAEKSLAVIDAKKLEFIRDISLPGSPEAFQLEPGRPRIFLNSPSASLVAVIDLEKSELVRRYPITLAGANFPLSLDQRTQRAFVGCRQPPTIVVLDTESGKEVSSIAIPADIDDLFFDTTRKRLYASCGEGFIAVIDQRDPDHYELTAKIATAKGARTSLCDRTMSRLFLVVPRLEGEAKDGPEIWIYRIRP